jgi:hypothetical protein
MPPIVLNNFGGMIPRADPTTLPANAAQLAQDVRLHAGVLRGWRRPALLNPRVSVASGTRTIYYEKDNGEWFTWGTDVNVVRGPVVDAEANARYYYTGDGVPKKTDSAMALIGVGELPRSWLHLGVPAPTETMTLSVTGTGTEGAIAEDRVYSFTYISLFSGIEEESVMGPPVTVIVTPGQGVLIQWPGGIPFTDGYNIVKRRVYRRTGANFQYVGETSTSLFTDTVLAENLGQICPSANYDAPPADLKGLCILPNGFAAGFSGSEVMFSVPYKLHAFPTSYRYSIPDEIVALQPMGNGLCILTNNRPYVAVGAFPDSMVPEATPKYAPCLSAASVAFDGAGVLYASYNGVARLVGNQVTTVTSALFTQEEWAELKPETMRGVFFDERYILWYDAPQP